MNKEYLSYSEIYLYLNNPNEYYLQYILGVKEPASEAMMFGSIVHDAIAGKCDLEKELIAKLFTANWIRVGKDLIKKAKIMPTQELPIYITGNKDNGLKCPVMAIFDGLDFEANEILERKTTKNGWRKQEDVDQADQLTMYAMGYNEMRRIIPKIKLERLDSNNGKVSYFETTRTQSDINYFVQRINQVYDELVSKDWWQRRKVRENNQIEEAVSNFKKYSIV